MTLTGCIGMLDGCGNRRDKLIDYYQVVKNSPLIDGKNILNCKLHFPNDPQIPNIQFIEWNKELIKVITNEDKHYIIVAKGKNLCCGCGDKVLGPFNKSDYILNLMEINQSRRLENHKEYKY